MGFGEAMPAWLRSEIDRALHLDGYEPPEANGAFRRPDLEAARRLGWSQGSTSTFHNGAVSAAEASRQVLRDVRDRIAAAATYAARTGAAGQRTAFQAALAVIEEAIAKIPETPS